MIQEKHTVAASVGGHVKWYVQGAQRTLYRYIREFQGGERKW